MSKVFNFLIFLSLLALVACHKPQAGMQGPQAVSVATQKVAAGTAVYHDEYPATITALNQVELRPQVNGYITAIHFKEGDVVKKGQALYSIDQQQYEASYQQSLANLAVQEANLVKAQKDVERYRELNKHDAIAKQQVDNAEANYEAAVKQVEAAKAAVRSVQTNVRYTKIVARFDGTIGISQVRLGTAVSAGQTVLNTISSNNPIAADFVIDQKEIGRFQKLLNQGTKVKDSTFTLAVNGQNYPHPGTISFMDRAINSQTGTLTVRVSFSNPELSLRPGMTATLRVRNQGDTPAVMIPYKAVVEQLGEFFVYVVRTDSSKVTQQRVTLGKSVSKNIIIENGLAEGQTIVVEGVQNLREGSSIVEKNGNAPAAENKSEAKK